MSYPGLVIGAHAPPFTCDGTKLASMDIINDMYMSDFAFESVQTWEALRKWTARMKNYDTTAVRTIYPYFVLNECVAGDYGGNFHSYCWICLAEHEEDLEIVLSCAQVLLEKGFEGTTRELFLAAIPIAIMMIENETGPAS